MGSINISIASKKKCVSQFKLKSKLRGNRIDSYAGLRKGPWGWLYQESSSAVALSFFYVACLSKYTCTAYSIKKAFHF